MNQQSRPTDNEATVEPTDNEPATLDQTFFAGGWLQLLQLFTGTSGLPHNTR